MKPMAVLDEDRIEDELEYSSTGWRLVLISAGVMWLLVIGVFCSVAHAETNLAVICTAGASDGSARNACTATKYDRPSTGALCRAMASNTWRTCTALSPSDTVEACSTDVPVGAPSNPDSGAPCTNWVTLPMSALVVPAPIGTNTTGTIRLSWTRPDFTLPNAAPENLLTGYRLYSAAYGAALTALTTLPASALTFDAAGYGNGKYSFAVTAVYNLVTGSVESAQTGPASIEVKIPEPVPLTPGQPQSLSITGVQIGTPSP